MSKSLIPAVPISSALITLWLNWELGVALIIVMLSFGCLACHIWLCATTVRSRLREIPHNKRAHIRLITIRKGVRKKVPLLLMRHAHI